MHGTLLLESLIATPQLNPDVDKAIHQSGRLLQKNVSKEKLSEMINETYQYVENEIILPILKNDENLSNFESQIFPFSTRLRVYNMILLQLFDNLGDKKSSDLIYFEDRMYKELQIAFKASNIMDSTSKDIIVSSIDIFRNYDISIIDLAFNKGKKLGELMSIINTERLLELVSGGLLALYCLFYIITHNFDTRNLNAIINKLVQNTNDIQLFIDSSESILEFDIATHTIDNIAIIKPDGFDIDTNRMAFDKQYLIEYKFSYYVIEKDKNSSLIINEVV